MPVLSAYFGVSDISLLIEKKESVFEILNFPYTYSLEAFSNQCTPQEFYISLIETLLKERKQKLSSFDVLLTGFLAPPTLSIDVKLSVDLMTLIKQPSQFYPIYVNNFTVLTPNAVLSYEMLNKVSSTLDKEEEDYYANLALYPQLSPIDITKQAFIDKSLATRVQASPLNVYKNVKSVVFTGSRFNSFSKNPELFYTLMMDLIEVPGIYEIFIDKNNIFPLLQLYKRFKSDTEVNYLDYIEKVGFLINSGGDTECLVSSELETKQFFEVKKNDVFVMPMDPSVSEHLSLKSKVLGTLEEDLKGGKLGLFVDAREVKSPLSDNVKLFNSCIKQLSLCLHQ